jgi:hypothetical protein
MKFNLQSLMGILQLAPYMVEGVFQIHSTASTETKTQIATDALQLAAGVTGAVLTGPDAAIAGAAATGIQAIIQALTHAKAAGATILPATAQPAVKA